jgi:alpha-ribazole phosphatase
MEVYVIRHTTPKIEKGICYGYSDIPLADTFEHEWNTLRETLPSDLDVVFSSPLTRCLKLADKIKMQYSIPIITDIRLKEMNFGLWELLRWDAIDPVALNFWMENYIHVCCPQGESYNDLFFRVNAFWTDLLQGTYNKVAIVTHGGVAKAINGIVNHISLADAMSFRLGFSEWCRYEVGK